MTYRKLFLWLLTASTLAVAVLWWYSLGYMFELRWSRQGSPGLRGDPPGWRMGGELHAATISLFAERPRYSSNAFYWNHSSLSHEVFHLSPFGQFDFEPVTGKKGSLLDLSFPLWLPWLVFTGGSFWFCRRMEKRAGCGGEEAGGRGRLMRQGVTWAFTGIRVRPFTHGGSISESTSACVEKERR